jgi:protein-S-isoprenylcysteine O-methyltransferase Ste14
VASGEAADRSGTDRAAPPPRDRGEGQTHRSSRLFTNRNLFGTCLALFLVLFPYWRLEFQPWHFIAGFGIVLLGMALRGWSIRQIGGSARKTSKLKANLVISWGPYSLVRNPIYIANITMFAGFTIVAGFPWLLPVVLVGLGMWYGAVVRREETFLAANFPKEFGEYQASTNRWIPKFQYRRRPDTIPPYPFLKIVRRERGGLIAIFAASSVAILARLLLY